MGAEENTVDRALHRKLAVDLFNLTWDLLDKAERTVEEDDKMVHAAHASRYHWGEVGTPLEFERGEWQISRVYAVLGRAEPALYHAQRCRDICSANGFGDFDLAFAYEAVARAYAIAGDTGNRDANVALATAAGAEIEDEGNKVYFSSELGTV